MQQRCIRGRWTQIYIRSFQTLINVLLLLVIRWVVSYSLWPHGLQHTRIRASLSFTVSRSFLKLMSIESVMPSSYLILCHSFSYCPQSFPASESFSMSRLFTSGGQSIGASASASVLPVNIQDWFPLGLTGLISLLSKGLSRIFSSTTIRKHHFFCMQPSLWSNSHICTYISERSKEKTLSSNARDTSSTPGLGTKIPHALGPKKKPKT